MVKKFSYLVSVSVLASSLFSSTSHAVFDDELRDVINTFLRPSSQVTTPSSSSSHGDEDSSWWDTTCAAASSLLSGTGHSLRYLGDAMRGDESIMGNFLVSSALSLAETVEYEGVSATKLVTAVKTDEGALKSFRKTSGNTLRYVGQLMAGETPTLEREIRQFWIDKRLADNPEEVFISTACALYCSKEVNGVDEIKLNYRKFTETWNSSSYTVPSHDAEQSVEWFLKGIIRGFVMNNQVMGSFKDIESQMAPLGIAYENLPVTKAITAETVVPNVAERGDLTPMALKERIDQARQETFMNFVEHTYKFEFLKKQLDQVRSTKFQAPPALSTTPVLMIKYHQQGDAAKSVDN